jgi:hypothetical protein
MTRRRLSPFLSTGDLMVSQAQDDRPQSERGTAQAEGTRRAASDSFASHAGTAADPSITAQFDALRVQVSRYLSVEADRVKLAIRRLVIHLVLGMAAAVVGLAILVTASVLLLSGLAGLIARWVGISVAAGNLIVGLATLSLIALGAAVALRSMTRTSFQRTRTKHERLRNRASVPRNVGNGVHRN